MTIQLGLSGASGRMGREILRVLPEFIDFSLKSALVSKSSQVLGQPCQLSSTSTEVYFSDDLSRAISGCNVVMDFSSPLASIEIARSCAQEGIALLIGTTGFSPLQEEELRECAASCALLLAPNTSLGIFALHQISALAHKILGTEFQVEISEIHHAGKRDAPSGTALSLARELTRVDAELSVINRASQSFRRSPTEIGIASMRGGDVAGEHTVNFLGPAERLEITHRAKDRSIFARGAFALARTLVTLKHGHYTVRDMMSSR